MDLWSYLLTNPQTSTQFYGVTTGTVTDNADPDGLGRVQVTFPWLADTETSYWARVVTPMAGADRGIYFLPEIGDEVLVAFEQGNMNFPYIVGAVWNGTDKPPITNENEKNDVRLIKSRSGHTITLNDGDDDPKIEIADSSGKNVILLSTADNALTITADGDLTIQSQNGKLTLSGKGVEITSQAEVKMEASQNMDIKAGPQLNIKGSMVNLN